MGNIDRESNDVHTHIYVKSKEDNTYGNDLYQPVSCDMKVLIRRSITNVSYLSSNLARAFRVPCQQYDIADTQYVK
jgi:hypothetical protein